MTDRERSLNEVIVGIEPTIVPSIPCARVDPTVVDEALHEDRESVFLTTPVVDIDGIEPVIVDQAEGFVSSVDVTRDAEIGLAAGYLLRATGRMQPTNEGSSEALTTRADYINRSSLVTEEERVGGTGKTYKRLHLTEDGTRTAQYLEALVRGETAFSYESYGSAKTYLKHIYEKVKTQAQTEPDRNVRNAQLAIARRLIAEVRSNAYKNYKAHEKELRQAPARELIMIAIGHLGIASLAQEANLKSVYAYLRAQKTVENASVVASARQLVRLEHKKAQAEVEAWTQAKAEEARLAVIAETRKAKEEAIAANSQRVEADLKQQRIEGGLVRIIKLGGATLVASLVTAGVVQKIQGAEARRIDAKPTVIALPDISQEQSKKVVFPEQQAPRQESLPVVIRGSGPISLHVRYTTDAGAQDLKLGYQAQDPTYKFFSVNGLPRAQQEAELKKYLAAATKMGRNDIIGLEHGPVLFDACHSAMYLNRQVCGPLVRLADELADPQTGKLKSDRPIILEKRDSKSQQEDAQVVGWVKVPRYIKDARTGKTRQITIKEYIAYVRTQLPGVQFDGITSTCYIPEGKVLPPRYFLAAVTRRIPLDQVPAEYRPQQQNGEHMYTENVAPEPQKERASIVSRARNALKSRNRAGKSPWEIAKARVARKIARVG